ncbi:MAG: DNA replication/repair protein RecF [Pseudomonadota bacterium]
MNNTNANQLMEYHPVCLPLEQLRINHVRNIASADLSDLQQINVFYGSNGSGKTSVLEAIAFLTTTRSFRHANIRRFISFDQDDCSVFGRNESKQQPVQLGVYRSKKGDKRIKSQGETLTKLVDLAGALPFQLIYHKSFQVLNEGPSTRRKLMDWGVFHVEHEFKSLWLRLQRAVKQRNTLLRRMAGRLSPAGLNELKPWSSELVSLSSEFDQARRSYLALLAPLFDEYGRQFLGDELMQGVEFSYRSGWPADREFSEVLDSSIEKDVQRGHTQYGPHRASINITLNGIPVADVLSRGQLKVLLIAFKLAQGQLLYQKKNVRVIYLLDDLPSELDDGHLGLVCQALNQTESQLFITCIEKEVVSSFFNPDKSRLFHVEHGKINPLI